MNRSQILQVMPSVLVVVVSIIVWQVIVTAFNIPIYELPSPLQILNSLMAPGQNWLSNSLVTLYETIAGFILAVGIGIPLAIGLVYSVWFNRTAYPLILAVQVVPKAGLAPLLFLIFGFGFLPRALLTFLLAFFPIVINTASGLGSLDPDYVDLMRSLGSSRVRIFTMARFPNALPYIFDGMKVGVTLALIGAVVAELVQANEGLGYILLLALGEVGTPTAFAALLLLTAMGAGLFLIFVFAERFTVAWYFRSKQVRA